MENKPDSGTRVRVTSTRAGYQGRKAGRTFDVTPEEYVLRGPKGDGMLELVKGQGVTHAAVMAAAAEGVNLADVPGKRTARSVRSMKK